MAKIEWGDPIEVDGNRPDWLDDNEGVAIHWCDGAAWNHLETPAYCVRGWERSIVAIRLRADHPYYLATSKGFTYWPGGDSAPDDWDGDIYGVIYRDNSDIGRAAYNWRHCGVGSDIIGYKRRVETDNEDCVRVKRMTVAEYQRDDNGSLSWARRVGIIREETLQERFTRETGIAVSEEIEAFIEWQSKS